MNNGTFTNHDFSYALCLLVPLALCLLSSVSFLHSYNPNDYIINLIEFLLFSHYTDSETIYIYTH